MKPINKKKILLTLGVLAFISIVFVVYQTWTGSNKALQTESFKQKINIPNYLEGGSVGIENKINESDFKFPSKLPYLHQINTSILTDAQVKNIATNLEFTGDPLAINDVENGISFIWNGDKYSLMVTPKTKTILFVSVSGIERLVQNSTNKQLSETEYKTTAQDFLIKKVGLDQTGLNFSGFSYFRIDNDVEYLGKATKDNHQVIQLNYSQSPSKYPILTSNPDETQFSVQILKDGTIASFKGNLQSSFQNSPNEYPLKNYLQFSNELNKAILVSLNDNKVNLPDVKQSDIGNIIAQKVSLVYLMEKPGQEIVQLVFLIEGTATLSGFNTPVNVSLYLPAFIETPNP